MYYDERETEMMLKAAGYLRKQIKPWNVREGDIMVLSDASRPRMPTIYIPVKITITDSYEQFHRESSTNPNSRIARTAYRFYHKPINSDDLHYLYDRHKTEGWNRFDTVEIFRKPVKTT